MILIGSPAVTSRLRTRSLEIMLAVMMLNCGLTLLLPRETFLLPQWQYLRQWADEETLGVSFVVVGLIRWGAVIVNGRYTKSPLWRIAGCLFGAFFWAAILVAALEGYYYGVGYWQGYGMPLFVPVTFTCTCFEIFAAYRCAIDASEYDSLGLRRRAFDKKHGRNG